MHKIEHSNALKSPVRPRTSCAPRQSQNRLERFCKTLQAFCKGVSLWGLGDGLIPAANEVIDAPSVSWEAANAFALGDDGKMFIAYGDYVHPKGVQRLSKEAGIRLAANMNTMRAKLAKRFGGFPVYKGHPDVPEFQGRHKDDSAYGWVTDIIAGDEGIEFVVKWSNAGLELIKDGRYKFYSPYWGLDLVGHANGRQVGEPSVFYSMGLTNTPVIPVTPFANQKPTPEGGTDMDRTKIIALLKDRGVEVPENATDEEILALVETALKSEPTEAEKKAEADAEAEAKKKAEEEAKAKADAEAEKKAEEEKAKKDEDDKTKAANMIIDHAVTEGKIVEGDRKQWLEDFGKDYAGTLVKVANAKPVMHTEPKTKDLGTRKTTGDAASQFTDAVNKRMKDEGEPYDIAWANCMETHKSLYEAMNQPKCDYSAVG